MVRRCAWHPKYFGTELILGDKPPYEDKSFTDGICSDCLARFEAGLKTVEKEVIQPANKNTSATSSVTTWDPTQDETGGLYHYRPS